MPGILAAVFNVLVSVVLPVAVLAWLLIKKRWHHTLAFGLGVAAFVVSQNLLRLPLLSWLGSQLSFVAFAARNPVLYTLLLCFSAGLFEETARYAAMRLFMKGRTAPSYGIAFGIGHGGFEAAWLAGGPWLSALASQSLVLRHTSPLDILPSGVERLFAIALHVGFSLVVLAAVRRKRPLLWLLAIALHGAANTVVVFTLQYTGNVWLCEGVMALATTAVLFIAARLSKDAPTQKEELP
ncbi:YhfC family intramembrane metalloprotease [Ruminococcaceae bacterium OttesenSCG-928-O06]|nr:YhfC family intramembrane metalloprotease [Ruminococcaceae bacterium OttesenSCG-928-O06]